MSKSLEEEDVYYCTIFVCCWSTRRGSRSCLEVDKVKSRDCGFSCQILGWQWMDRTWSEIQSITNMNSVNKVWVGWIQMSSLLLLFFFISVNLNYSANTSVAILVLVADSHRWARLVHHHPERAATSRRVSGVRCRVQRGTGFLLARLAATDLIFVAPVAILLHSEVRLEVCCWDRVLIGMMEVFLLVLVLLLHMLVAIVVLAVVVVIPGIERWNVGYDLWNLPCRRETQCFQLLFQVH